MHMQRSYEREVTLSEKTKMPAAIVASTLTLAVYGTILYDRVCAKIDAAMTVTQAQEWIDDARDKNPQIYWPRLPEKHPVTLTAKDEGQWP